MEYINSYYGTDYAVGDELVFDGTDCVIIGAKNAKLKVRFTDGHTGYLHPTWKVTKKSDSNKEPK